MEKRFSQRLLDALGEVPDPRHARGKRHPLNAILALAVLAMLCGARSLYAIAQWGRLQPPELVHALGFTREQTPVVSTLHEVFSALDAEAFEEAVRGWAQTEFEGRAISIDGKSLRGIHGEALPGVDLLAAYSPEAGRVLAQVGGQEGTGGRGPGRRAPAAGRASAQGQGGDGGRTVLPAGHMPAGA
jgi:hypothetical protein